MVAQYRCKNERRRALLRQQVEQGTTQLNGIDYLEVKGDQTTLTVYFLHELTVADAQADVPLALSLTADNIQIMAESGLQPLAVEAVTSVANELRVRLRQPGGYVPYTLTLVQADAPTEPPLGIDSQLATVEFRFWMEAVSEFDCQTPNPPTPEVLLPPVIDYLAKDYASFRQLMLDRLAVTMPEWQERNPADMGVMVVELLAYAADHLSYYQDAVATEAYLGTCRRRVSMRRHGRLLDYFMHDGCNARAWVVLRLTSATDPQSPQPDPPEATDSALKTWPEEGITLLGPDSLQGRSGVPILSRTTLSPGAVGFDSEDYWLALNQGAQVFETLHDLTLFAALDELQFYTWGDEQCALPRGATRATLQDPDGAIARSLTVGRVLILQEVRGATTGDPRDADLQHRYAVRLTQVEARIDRLTSDRLVEIGWNVADALPFALPISGVNADGVPFCDPLSVAYGNVVLADAGRTRTPENLRERPDWWRLRPRLAEYPLTRQGQVQTDRGLRQPFDPDKPARQAMEWSLRNVKPAIVLWERQEPDGARPGGPQWQPQQDLLISDRFARDFVVESEEDGRMFLRFGDGHLGKIPQAETPLIALYRTGNGQSGNVGANTLINIVIRPDNLPPGPTRTSHFTLLQSALKPTNPLPAQGGVDPEPIEQVRLDAPQAFREVLRRAVTEADYETLTAQYPGVERAVASRRWTGSWYTIFIAADLANGRPLDDAFKQDLLAYLEEFRLAGHDLAIEKPQFVPLDLALQIQVQPDYFRSAVKTALLDSFSNRLLANDQRGFFHPDNLTFGQSVYLSQIVARAMQVEGVQAATVSRFQRLGDGTQTGLTTGVLRFERLEIAQLDNLPSLPENGRLELKLEGGL